MRLYDNTTCSHFTSEGVLAELYSRPSPFLLTAEEAFKFIPPGYLSFLLLVVPIIWLMPKLDISGWRPGLTFGLTLGAPI